MLQYCQRTEKYWIMFMYYIFHIWHRTIVQTLSWQFWWDWPLMCSVMLFWFFHRSNDSGLLSHKEHLPVRVLAVGDINRLGSEAAYRVGPLQCYGDSKYRTDLITLWALTLSNCQTHHRYISSAGLAFHVLNENNRRTI